MPRIVIGSWQRVWALSLLLGVLLVHPGQDTVAQTTGKVAGTITDAVGEPLPGVNVRLDGTTVGAITDVEGRYFILNIVPGSYDLVATFVGFQAQRVSGVRVQVDRTTTVDLALQEETVGMEEVTILADRAMVVKDRTSASAKVDGEAILSLPVDNFIDAVALQAGVTRGAGGSLHIRGGRASEVKYYVDGVPVSNPFSNALAAPVENTAVQEVEVISGTFNAEFGQANSGIVNIVTQSGSDQFRATAITSLGSYVSGRTDVHYDIDAAPMGGERRFEASLSGPTPLRGLTFFSNVAVTDLQGWIFGREIFLPSDSSNFSASDPNQWLITSSGDSSIVPMRGSQGLTYLGKLTYQVTPSIRLAYSYTANDFESQLYQHAYRYLPGYLPTQQSARRNQLLTVNHVLNARTFYDLRLSSYSTALDQARFEDPYDPRYASIWARGIQPTNTFKTGGVDPNHIHRESTTLGLRFDISRQFGYSHLVKAGIEWRRHDMIYEQFVVQVDPRQTGGSLDPFIPDRSTNRNNYYRRTPVEAAAFIQDKIEIADLVVNAGIRFDYFNAQATVPTDLKDPSNQLRPRPADEAFVDATAKVQVSPRLGFAFPITETGVIHASFGQFFQIPPLERLYENPEFEVTLGSFNTFLGNADLEAQRSSVYEIGLQQGLGANVVADITAYYRDVRYLLGTGLYSTYTGSDTYGRYENKDFGNVRGITAAIVMRVPEAGIRGSLNYTYQSARGNGSDPRQAFYDAQGNNEASRVLVPLDWDQRHNLNVDLSINQAPWRGSVVARYLSGYPFTPYTNRRVSIPELRNAARYDAELAIDLRFSRDVTLGPVRMQLFSVIENILDAYRQDRFRPLLPTELAGHAENGLERINTLPEYVYSPTIQPAPRQIRLGLQIDV